MSLRICSVTGCDNTSDPRFYAHGCPTCDAHDDVPLESLKYGSLVHSVRIDWKRLSTLAANLRWAGALCASFNLGFWRHQGLLWGVQDWRPNVDAKAAPGWEVGR